MRRWGWILAVAFAFGGCGDWDEGVDAPDLPAFRSPGLELAIVADPANASRRIRIGAQSFTEQRVLAAIYAEALRAAGYRASFADGYDGPVEPRRALARGEIDAIPAYTGSALTVRFGVDNEDVPRSDDAAYDMLVERLAARRIMALAPTPFSSSNEVAVTQATARRYGLRRISDLRRVDERLSFYAPPDCAPRTDCLAGLRERYGLRFGRFVPVEIDRRHEVLLDGTADVSIVFSTDPQISREGLVVLEDDRELFFPNNSTLTVPDAVVERAGFDLARVISDASRNLTAEVMQELNARVDYDGQSPRRAARGYLRDFGLVAR